MDVYYQSTYTINNLHNQIDFSVHALALMPQSQVVSAN